MIRMVSIGILTLTSLLSFSAGFALTSDLRLPNAAKQGDKQAVLSLLKQHVDVNSRLPDGATALAWAAYRDDLDMADDLIRAGAKVNLANDYAITPLSLACGSGSARMVQKLLNAGADPNIASLSGATALMNCARTGDVEAVQSLLARGAGVNAIDAGQRHTALMFAASAQHPAVVRVLIEHGADVNTSTKDGFTALLFSAQQGDIDSARLLLAAGANVNYATPGGDTGLLIASLSGHEAFCIFLLDAGADPNAADRNGLTALHYTALKGLTRIVGILPHFFAPYLTRPNMPELAQALLAHGANPNARLIAPTVLYDNVGLGYDKVLYINTLPAGTMSPVGATPFFLAAMSYDANLMRLLVKGGADPLLATQDNITPVMAAAGLTRQRNATIPLSDEEQLKALEAVKLAVQLGVDVNASESRFGLTALHGAAFNGSDSIVQFLVEKRANLNAQDKFGQTPLDKAANIKPKGAVPLAALPVIYRKSTVDLLVKLGAKVPDSLNSQDSDVAAAKASQ